MRIKITYDGRHPMTAKITNAETGEHIDGVFGVRFELTLHEATATLLIRDPLIDVVMDADVKNDDPYQVLINGVAP